MKWYKLIIPIILTANLMGCAMIHEATRTESNGRESTRSFPAIKKLVTEDKLRAKFPTLGDDDLEYEWYKAIVNYADYLVTYIDKLDIPDNKKLNMYCNVRKILMEEKEPAIPDIYMATTVSEANTILAKGISAQRDAYASLIKRLKACK